MIAAVVKKPCLVKTMFGLEADAFKVSAEFASTVATQSAYITVKKRMIVFK